MGRLRPRPTDSELAILRILWDRGPSTVRQVHEAFAGTRDTGYTTTLKLMQIMADKGLVTRNESARTHVYAATASETQTQRQLVKDLVDRAFGGSAAALLMHALDAEGATPDELREMRKLIADYREKRQ
jgi:BlaI family transcriptional regulator, penicillinase repressor